MEEAGQEGESIDQRQEELHRTRGRRRAPVLGARGEQRSVARPELLVEPLEVADAPTEPPARISSVIEDEAPHVDRREAGRRESHPEIPVLDPAAELPAAGLEQELTPEQGDSRRGAHE